MAKNVKIISMSVLPAQHSQLRKYAYSQDLNVSEYARTLIDSFAEINPETLKKLQEAAAKREISVAKLVEQMVERCSIDDDTIRPIMLKIPLPIIKDRVLLQKWLEGRSEALLKHLFP